MSLKQLLQVFFGIWVHVPGLLAGRMAGAMVGNPEVSFSTIVSFIIYDLPRIDGTQNGIANKVFLNTQTEDK